MTIIIFDFPRTPCLTGFGNLTMHSWKNVTTKQATSPSKFPESRENTHQNTLQHNETTTHRQKQKPPTYWRADGLEVGCKWGEISWFFRWWKWKSLAAAAAAKSLQSCWTLCNPIDSSPPGSAVPGILQAGTLEWVAHFLLQCMKVKSENEVAQSCLTLRDPMDCSLPGSFVYGIFQARVLEWVAIPFSRGSSQPKDRT